jgi:molybdate transport system substrate-binding protein
MKSCFSSVFIFVLALTFSSAARAQTEVTLIAPGGARDVMNKLIPDFEAKTGYKVKATFGTGAKTKQQVAHGEAVDVAIVQPPLDEVLASGNVVVASQTPLATVAVAVAVKKGMPKLDISTPDAVKRALLTAKSIAYPDPGVGATAGVSFEASMTKLGIMDQMKIKSRLVPTGVAAMDLTAKGEVEIGLTFMSEMSDPGIDIVGALPASISPPTTLFGFISAHAKDPAAAKALLDYLSSPVASASYKEARMKPAH